jgi:hypothetical protein
MLRIGATAAVLVGLAALASEAKAQIIVGSGFGVQRGHSRAFHRELTRRELHRQRIHALAHEEDMTFSEHARLHRSLNRDRFLDELAHEEFHRRNDRVFFAPVYPSGVFGSRDPFAGSPRGGNFYYWLTQEHAQGRVPRSTYNKLMYPQR